MEERGTNLLSSLVEREEWEEGVQLMTLSWLTEWPQERRRGRWKEERGINESIRLVRELLQSRRRIELVMMMDVLIIMSRGRLANQLRLTPRIGRIGDWKAVVVPLMAAPHVVE